MNIAFSAVLFVVGLGLILFSAEKLVKGVIGTALGFGLSTFMVSVIFVGFDAENLAVGAVGSYEEVPGIALGTIIGSAMVAIALAFGITALLSPMRFAHVSRRLVAVPVLSVLLMGLLSLDGTLSRADGLILLAGFALAVFYLLRLSRSGLDIRPSGEVAKEMAEVQEEVGKERRWVPLAALLLALAGIALGSELVVRGAERMIAVLGLSETVFGMTVLAFLISIEELGRELPAAMQGRPEISFGNVAGSVLAFFLFNAGVIALVRPIPIPGEVLNYYLPLVLGTTVLVSLFMLTGRVGRWSGGVLVGVYVAFVLGGYLWFQ